jgi:hypothetical protein
VASVRFDDPEAGVDTEDLAPLAAFAEDVATLEDPDVACEDVEEVPELVVLLALVPLWLAPGSVKAIAPVASTPATPTPAVTADNRFMPRLRSTPAATGGSAGLTGIRFPFVRWSSLARAGFLARRRGLLTTKMPGRAQGRLWRPSQLLLNAPRRATWLGALGGVARRAAPPRSP